MEWPIYLDRLPFHSKCPRDDSLQSYLYLGSPLLFSNSGVFSLLSTFFLSLVAFFSRVNACLLEISCLNSTHLFLLCCHCFLPLPIAIFITLRQRWQQVIFCKSKSSHKSFPCKSKSSHKSFGQTSSSFGQTSSQVIWSKHMSSHKSLCPSTSQVAHYFFHSRHKKGNIIKSKRK